MYGYSCAEFFRHRYGQEVHMQQTVLDVITLLLADERDVLCAIHVDRHQAGRGQSSQRQGRTMAIEIDLDRFRVTTVNHSGQLAFTAQRLHLLANYVTLTGL